MGEENNENVQNFPTNPGPSTLEIQPKTCNEVSPLEAQNSLVEYTQVINISDYDNNKDNNKDLLFIIIAIFPI